MSIAEKMLSGCKTHKTVEMQSHRLIEVCGKVLRLLNFI